MTLWRSGALALWRSGALALWRSGALALWRSGALALWRSGALALALASAHREHKANMEQKLANANILNTKPKETTNSTNEQHSKHKPQSKHKHNFNQKAAALRNTQFLQTQIPLPDSTGPQPDSTGLARKSVSTEKNCADIEWSRTRSDEPDSTGLGEFVV